MDRVRIQGGHVLRGEIAISGAKNAALPLMAACLLTDKEVRLLNLPQLMDIATMTTLLAQHGVEFVMGGCPKHKGHMGEVISLQAHTITNEIAPYDIVRKMRASVLVLGPLLARIGRAKISLPGGCAIGTRPIDLHLKAFEKMGVKIKLEKGYVHAHIAGRLKAAHIVFDIISVGATENVLMAATLAKGTTIIENAAKEPEVVDLAECLVRMGAHIEGIGTDKLIIEGVETLGGTEYPVVFDRIEAGTFMAAAAITHGEVELVGARAALMAATIDKLTEAGIDITETTRGLKVKRVNDGVKAVHAHTQPYPGFPTDMQAQLMALLTIAQGSSVISENIFENRFMHVPELMRLGADITLEGNTATIRGVDRLKGAPLMATDLRASVSLVIAALVARGETIINRMYHIDRGYERIEEKLVKCGAKIERLK